MTVSILAGCCTSIVPILVTYNYKQKQGRMNKNGTRSGIMNKLKPQVQTDPMVAKKIMVKMLRLKMKHPPGLR